MSRSIQVATIQLDATPAPRAERLKRAEQLIQSALDDNAELIVLPALFNTGQTLQETNYEVTERLNDVTMQWLKAQARKHQVHIAGSWMIVDKDDTYHSAFLVAPDGQQWRYDQQYPYLWERVFYRDGHGLCVAETSLGKIGMMIGWDVVHDDIWEQYAAKIDLLLVMNNALDYEQASLNFADKRLISVHDWGKVAHWLAMQSSRYLYDDLEAQGNWLNVPIICAGASGEFSSILPAPFFSVQALLLGQATLVGHHGTSKIMSSEKSVSKRESHLTKKDDLWQEAEPQYATMTLNAPFQRNTRILDANGTSLARVAFEGDSVITCVLLLADKTPLPLDEPQPEMDISQSAKFSLDLMTSALLTLNYRRGVRRQWGARMAPVDNSTRVWLIILMVIAGISALLGRLLIPKR